MQVKVLVEFMVENHGDIFGEVMAGLSCPSAEETPMASDRYKGEVESCHGLGLGILETSKLRRQLGKASG